METQEWRVWWQGSGPERGDHIMCGRERIAYFPAPDGTDGMHDQADAICNAHNAAIERCDEYKREALRPGLFAVVNEG